MADTNSAVTGLPPTVTVAAGSKSWPAMVWLPVSPGPPTPGPTENTIPGESSDVFPLGSVAAAVTAAPAGIGVTSTRLNDALPEASVVIWVEPR